MSPFITLLTAIKKLLAFKVDRDEFRDVIRDTKKDIEGVKNDIEDTKRDIEDIVEEVEGNIAQSDWNQNDENAPDYVKNRPFYEDAHAKNVFYEEQTITLQDGEYTRFEGDQWAEHGVEYTVVFDGVEYPVVCWTDSDTCMRLDFTHTSGAYVTILDHSIMANGLAGEHTFTVYEDYGSVKRLDRKFMPRDVLQQISNLFTSVSGKLDSDDPKITGSFSMHRLNGTKIGHWSTTLGRGNMAETEYSYAEGNKTSVTKDESKTGLDHETIGSIAYRGSYGHAEGYGTVVTGAAGHAEGVGTEARGTVSHAEGGRSIASGNYSHAEGKDTTASGGNSHAEGINTTASGQSSHAEGYKTVASGNYSHAEGVYTVASASYSHAEGNSTISSGSSSHSEGYETIASAGYSHAEGYYTTVTTDSDVKPKTKDVFSNGEYGHAEGYGTVVSGAAGHAEGLGTKASGISSHAEGEGTEANALGSHAEGYKTIAHGYQQHVQGKRNIEDKENKYAHIVGNGTSESARSNAHTLDWDGNAWYAGTLRVGGTSYDDAKEVALKEDIPQGGAVDEKEWRLLRSFTIPEDVTTDTSGIYWAVAEDGGVRWSFDTDSDGDPFECSEILINMNAQITSSSAFSFRRADGLIEPPSGSVSAASNGLIYPLGEFLTNKNQFQKWAVCKRVNSNKGFWFASANQGAHVNNLKTNRELVSIPEKFTYFMYFPQSNATGGFVPGGHVEVYGR